MPSRWRTPPNVLCGAAIDSASPYDTARAKFADAWRNRAVAFALVSIINSAVDYCVFLLARCSARTVRRGAGRIRLAGGLGSARKPFC